MLPADLDARALGACSGDRRLAADLLRFLLAHELGHVRNGDIIRFLPLLTTIRLAFRWCLVAIVNWPGLGHQGDFPDPAGALGKLTLLHRIADLSQFEVAGAFPRK
jgi:Zn-dependent protease with chaperone function